MIQLSLVFLSRTNLKLDNISVTSKMVKKVMTISFFWKLLNGRIVDHLEKYGHFSDFQYVLGLLD